MITETLSALFEREIDKLVAELELYQDEQNLWIISGTISNSAGNLTLHLIGNLNHFIGNCIGGSDYVRDRPLEFSSKNIPRQQMIENLKLTKAIVLKTISGLDEKALQEIHPKVMQEKDYTTEMLLTHLLTHLSYHLGQINYHRRLLDVQLTQK